MGFIDASQVPELPLAFMNADHAQEVQLLEDLGDALTAHRTDPSQLDAVLERLSLLAVHTREHFLREEQVMRETGFPAYGMHKGEHDRVLAEMDLEARRFREGGDPDRLWTYLFKTVPAWFVHHIRTMDRVTAEFVSSHPAWEARAEG